MGSITKNTGRHAMIQNAFLYSCKLCFQFTSLCYYMYHRGKKEIKKKRKKEKKGGFEKFASTGFVLGPSKSVRTKS